jgi:hypothetical protein
VVELALRRRVVDGLPQAVAQRFRAAAVSRGGSSCAEIAVDVGGGAYAPPSKNASD